MRSFLALAILLLSSVASAETFDLWARWDYQQCETSTRCRQPASVTRHERLRWSPTRSGTASTEVVWDLKLSGHQVTTTVGVEIDRDQSAWLPVLIEIDRDQEGALPVYRDCGGIRLRKITDLQQIQFPPVASGDGWLVVTLTLGSNPPLLP